MNFTNNPAAPNPTHKGIWLYVRGPHQDWHCQGKADSYLQAADSMANIKTLHPKTIGRIIEVA